MKSRSTFTFTIGAGRPTSRQDIIGRETRSMDDRYIRIDDEAREEARRKMELFQKRRGLNG